MMLDALDPSVALLRTCDVVIVGAGPAGITLARKLARYGDVLLLEAGDRSEQPLASDALIGAVSGLPYPLSETRARQFGGGTALWAGYCVPFDSHDFQKRSWLASSGWPIEAFSLEQHYAEAAHLLHVDDGLFDYNALGEHPDGIIRQLDGDLFEPHVWRFGQPTADFAEEYIGCLAENSAVTTILNACATGLRLSEDCHAIRTVEIRTHTGRTGNIRAKTIILAAGGIETARLMLASKQDLDSGVGNAHGNVGRWFMEHPHVTIEGIEMKPCEDLVHWVGVSAAQNGQKYTRCLGMSTRAQEENSVLNARAHFFRTPEMEETSAPAVGLFFEQAPNPDSYLTLTSERDAWGVRRVCLHWALTEEDSHSHRRVVELLASHLLDSEVAVQTGAIRASRKILHSNHQLGTTRMSENPRDGVVDGDCKVHGIDNLFIVGGSVFPTVSWANPTLTVLALSIRLAHHIINHRHIG